MGLAIKAALALLLGVSLAHADDLQAAHWLVGAEAALTRGAPGIAAFLAEAALNESELTDYATWVLAQATVTLECQTALDAIAALPGRRSAEERVVAAKAWRRCGPAEAAERAERELLLTAPTEPYARQLKVALSPAERLIKAEAEEKARDYDAARATLEALLTTEVADEAELALGKLILERLRDDYPRARHHFEQVARRGGPPAEEATYLKAKALGREGLTQEALKAFDAYQRAYPTGRWREDARFFAAFTLYEQPKLALAEQRFAQITEGEYAATARWYRAWCAYLRGAPQAVSLLDKVAKSAPLDTEDRRKAAYWAARALERRDPAEAKRRFAALIEEQPADWYGLLASRRVEGAPPSLVMLGGQESPLCDWPPELAARAARIERLRDEGHPHLARRYLKALMPALSAQKSACLARRVSQRLGQANLGMVAAGQVLPRMHRRLPTLEARDAWLAGYPLGYPERVSVEAARFGLDPLWIQAFIRKESAFMPEVISPAHAVGLMQLLPKTARRLDQLAGRVRSEPILTEPALNISLGTEYVWWLSARFGGQLPLVAAAYNAGPAMVAAWCAGQESVETDLFVERIPFMETRGYVKRMVESLVRYRLVYGHPAGQRLEGFAGVLVDLPPRLSLQIPPGIDF